MAEQSRLVVVAGRTVKAGVVTQIQAAQEEKREGTTGRIIPRVWAFAAPQAAQQPKQTAAKNGAETHKQPRNAPAEELGFYRKYTERLLQRYVQMTMEAGRVSSLMGREVLGGKASHYKIHGFDDAVIFRLDVEKCLRRLEISERAVIRRIAIQEYTHQEASELMGLSLRTVGARYSRAIDRLTGILLETRLLEPLKGCQVGEA